MKRRRTADTGTSLMSMDANLLELMLSFFLPKEANPSWETARIFCSCSKGIREKLLPQVFRQLCWPADVLSKFTGDLAQRREDVVYMTGYLGNFPIPPFLEHLSFGYAFNQAIVPGYLPATLTQLTFGSCFNHPIGEHVLPPALTELTFGHAFDQEINKRELPPDLMQLTFGHAFNQRIEEGVLPSSLTQLAFGPNFNQVVVGIMTLPCLERLTMPRRDLVRSREAAIRDHLDRSCLGPSELVVDVWETDDAYRGVFIRKETD